MSVTALPEPATRRRRSVRGLLRKLTVSAAVAGSLVIGAGTAQAIDVRAVTDDYLFSKSLSGFVSVRGTYPSDLDWSTDACSWSPDKPLGYNFTQACWRHDFGYRNYKKQSRFTDANRLKIDNNFYDDMKDICNGAGACNAAAWTYYQAVRQFGAS
ncbi:phospholipase [Amycolatopsis sp. YIM 10]|uniref:phospholipase n=1 Tax=Amycolatopsis sp. YIM 10 TaxID=2653857 RepID=UPI0012907860|nr:phospholipase [Amycolatopsis sp. YIM 10]QFU92316.1 Prokaryotic phospholipase A2 [Amycolatopsis sp. YIM 10]